jgi:hypothetical protein
MKRFRSLFLATLILLAISFGAFRWSAVLQMSLLAFGSSPPAAPASGQPLPVLTPQVVVVIVSGLSYQQTRLQSMPIWQNLADVGASVPLTVQPPAGWASVWNTLLSGAGPERNGAALLDPALVGVRPIAADNLLATARNAGMRTAVAAASSRAGLFTMHAPDDLYLAVEPGATGDGQVVAAALAFIAARQHNLILVHLDQPAEVGRSDGTGSLVFRSALRQVDSYVRQITHQMDLENSLLVLTSDGALLSDGRPAGGENPPPDLPLVMVGQRVVAGTYSPVRLPDVAPTLATWLGTRLPAASEGRPLFELLEPDTHAAARYMALAAQQAALADTYTSAVSASVAVADTSVAPPQEQGIAAGAPGMRIIQEDLARARMLFRTGNPGGAIELARLVIIESAAQMKEARTARQQAERTPRLLPLALGVAVPWLLFWLRRPPRPGACILGALLATATFYGLYRLENNTLTFTDTLNPHAQIGLPLARNTVIGLLLGSLPLGLVLLSDSRSGEQHTGLPLGEKQPHTSARWLSAVGAGYDYALYTAYLVLLPVLLAYWQQGAWITWYFPDTRLLVLQGFGLHVLALAALLGSVVGWLLGAVVWAAEQLRARARKQRARAWDPIAYLRR